MKKESNNNVKSDHVNPFLETDKEHKKWYNVQGMGKQLGKPKAVPPKVKKPKKEK